MQIDSNSSAQLLSNAIKQSKYFGGILGNSEWSAALAAQTPSDISSASTGIAGYAQDLLSPDTKAFLNSLENGNDPDEANALTGSLDETYKRMLTDAATTDSGARNWLSNEMCGPEAIFCHASTFQAGDMAYFDNIDRTQQIAAEVYQGRLKVYHDAVATGKSPIDTLQDVLQYNASLPKSYYEAIHSTLDPADMLSYFMAQRTAQNTVTSPDGSSNPSTTGDITVSS